MDRHIPQTDQYRRLLRRWLKPALIVILLLAAGRWAIAGLRPSLSAERLRVAEVAVEPLESVVVASGLVQPAQERVITSPLPARLITILRYPGSRVSAGEALLELDLASSQLAAAQLDDQIQQQQAQLRRLGLDLESEHIALRTEKDVKALEREEADLDLKQRQTLFTQGLVSELDRVRSQTRAKRVGLELEGLKARLDNAAKAAEAKLDEARSVLDSLLDQKHQLQSDLSRASTRVEEDGVVTWVVEDEGSMLNAGEPLARVADLGSFRIEATISDVHGNRLHLSQRVRIPVAESSHGGDSGTSTETYLEGQIDRILPSVDEGSLRFWVRLDDMHDASRRLRSNQRLEVWVITETLPPGPTLTKAGYYSGPGPHDLFVLNRDRNQAIRRTVELGVAGRRSVQVISGLQAGERVVISNVSDLQHLSQWTVRPWPAVRNTTLGIRP